MKQLRGPSAYSLHQRIGEGGFCSVFRTTDLRSGRTVAVKCLRPDTRTPEQEETLRREFLLLSRLRHPNIVSVVDFHNDDDLGPVIVLEYVAGEPFAPSTCLSPEELIEAIAQLCRALSFLHARGLVHGDLKAENVLILRPAPPSDRSDPQSPGIALKLLDLGLAARIRPGFPLPRRGTPSFAAPEVLRGLPADHRADLYALGALIVEAARPLSSPSHNARADTVTDLQVVTANVVECVKRLTDDLLQPDPSKRPSSAADVLEMLRDNLQLDIPFETHEGRLAALESIDMVGRRVETQRLLTACGLRIPGVTYHAAMPSVFLAYGEAGVGKTRLVRGIVETLKAHCIPYFLGLCRDHDGSPFEPFQQLLTAPSEPDGRSDLQHNQLQPEDSNPDQLDRPVWAEFRRHRRLDAVTDILCRAITGRHRLVIVEDLHRSDEETFDVFLRLAARASSCGFVLLATFRTEGLLAQRLEHLLEDHLTTLQFQPFPLARLAPSETEEFILNVMGPHRDLAPLTAMAHRVTMGNPLFLLELLRGLMQSGQVCGGPFRWNFNIAALQFSGIPLTLRDLVRGRLVDVPASEAALLEWLAVFAEPTSIALLHEASGLPYAELRFLLGALVRRGLVTRDSRGKEEQFKFSHNLFAEGVYETLPPLRRAELHRGVGVALERAGPQSHDEHLAHLAHHFLRAGEATKGPEYALEAASRAQRRGATHRAISLYHSCLDLLATAKIDLRYQTLERLAYLLRQVGDVGRAETFYFEMLLASRKRLDTKNEAIALAELGRIRADRAELVEATAFIERALNMHRSSGDREAEAEATLLLAAVVRASGDHERALELARQSKDLAQLSGSLRTVGLSANVLGLVLMSLRRYEEAHEEFTSGLRMAESGEHPINYLVALGNIGWVHLERGALDAAAEVFERCIAAWAAQGFPHGGPAVALNAGEVDRLRGALEDARSRLQKGLSAAQRSERSELVHYAIYSLGLVDLEQGALGEAQANLTRAHQMSERSGARAASALTLVALGELAIQLGHASAAEGTFGRAAEVGEIVRDELIRSGALAGLAETSARTIIEGSAEAAERAADAPVPAGQRATSLADEAYALAQNIGSKQAMVRADLAGALAYLAAGELENAMGRARRAEELAQECGLRPDRARALLARGMIHASSRRLEEAAACLEDSRALAEEMGLRAVVARACAEMSGVARARGADSSEVEFARRAASILQDLARTLPEPEDRERFMSVRWRRRVMDLAAAAEATGAGVASSDSKEGDHRPAGRADSGGALPSSAPRVDGAPPTRPLLASTPDASAPNPACSGTAPTASRSPSASDSSHRGVPGGATGDPRPGPAGGPGPGGIATADPHQDDVATVEARPDDVRIGGGASPASSAEGALPRGVAPVDRAVPSPPSNRAVEEPRSVRDPETAGDQATDAATGAAASDLRSAVTLLLEEALRSITCDRGLVLLIAPEGTSEIVVARGLESESIQDARSYCRGVVDRAAQGEEVLVVDTSRDERFRDRRSVSLFNIVSIICLPLRFGSKVVGALYLDSRAGSRLLRDAEFAAARRVAARMTSTIQAAWEQERRHEEALLKQKALCQAYRLDAITGESAAMKKVFRVLEAVIASDCNVLVVGESGTGKELAARAIHFSGRRKMAPFVPLDCGALPDSLVESELFGYRKGAFTGADTDRQGLFEEADGGTLFLDEITNTSTVFQGKLLRVLQTGEFRRVGDPTPRKVDVRIIAATNVNLEEAMRAGRFREDLYYRLNVVTVQVPPLRERREDVPALAEQFARAFCEKEKIAFRGIGESALARLCEHTWPGNVRELKNAVESALILSRDGAVRREFLPESVRGGSFGEIRRLLRDGTAALAGRPAASETNSPHPEEGSTGASSGSMTPGRPAAPAGPAGAGRPEGWMTESERRALKAEEDRSRILDALARAAGDKSLAAEILGCSRMTLYRRMRRLGITYVAGSSE